MAKTAESILRRRRLAGLISEKRRELGMTQDVFGEWIGRKIGATFSFAAIQRWENLNDTSMPRSENLRAIALAFGLTIDELNAYLDDPTMKSIDQASKSLARQKKEIEKSPELIRVLIQGLPLEEQINTFQWLSKNLIELVKDCKSKLKASEEKLAEYEKVKRLLLNNSTS